MKKDLKRWFVDESVKFLKIALCVLSATFYSLCFAVSAYADTVESDVSMFGFTMPTSDGGTVDLAFAFHKDSGTAITGISIKKNGVEVFNDRQFTPYSFEGSVHASTWTTEIDIGAFLVIEYADGSVMLHYALRTGKEGSTSGTRVL